MFLSPLPPDDPVAAGDGHYAVIPVLQVPVDVEQYPEPRTELKVFEHGCDVVTCDIQRFGHSAHFVQCTCLPYLLVVIKSHPVAESLPHGSDPERVYSRIELACRYQQPDERVFGKVLQP